MATILLSKSSLNNISSQLKKMQSETEAARTKVNSAIKGLDFEVASKQNIKSLMSKLNTSLSRQISLSEQHSSTFLNVSNTLIDSDGKFGAESQSIFDKVKDFIEDSAKSIKDFLINNKIAKYGVVAGLFLVSPSTLCFTSTIILLDKIAAWFKNLFGGSETVDTSNNSTNTVSNTTPSKPEDESDANNNTAPKEDIVETTPEPEPDTPQETPSSPAAFEPTNYEPTDDLLRFVGSYEGYSSTIYVCPAGKDTIGYGHVLTSEAEYQKYANGITKEQALELMRQDMQRFNNSLKKFVTSNNIQLTQCQYDALLSFSFNCGSAWMTNSSGLSKLLINGEFDKVGAKLGEYVKGGGQVLPGLVNRRADEAELFNNGDYIRNH